MRPRMLGWEISPALYLTISNVVAAIIGFFLSVFSARSVGAEVLGAFAIIQAICSSTAAFLDVRSNDLASKLYYPQDTQDQELARKHKAGVIKLAILFTICISTLLFLLSAAISPFIYGYFTKSEIFMSQICLIAMSTSVRYISSSILYLLRLSSRFYVLGTVSIISQLISSIAFVFIIYSRPDLVGLVWATSVSSIVQLLSVLIGARYIYNLEQLNVFQACLKSSYQLARKNLGFLAYGNVLGYAKLLQRGTDVLLFALFADDKQVGIYKLARSWVDSGLGIFQESLYQVYYPTSLELIAKKKSADFVGMSRRLFMISLFLTAIFLVAGYFILPTIIPHLLGAQFKDAASTMVILALSFVFLAGLHPWLWAIFVSGKSLWVYTIFVYGAVFIQYLCSILLYTSGHSQAVYASMAALTYYVFLAPVLVYYVSRLHPEYIFRAPSSSLSER